MAKLKFTSLECFAMDKLNCGIDDLQMLDYIYSPLGETYVNTYNVVNRHDTLNDILSELFDSVLYDVCYYIRTLSRKDVIKFNDDTELKITAELGSKMRELAIIEEGYGVYVNYLDTKFFGNLEDVIDWDLTVADNALLLIQYWLEEGKLC